MRFELALGGTLQDKLALVEKVLGKEIKISEYSSLETMLMLQA